MSTGCLFGIMVAGLCVGLSNPEGGSTTITATVVVCPPLVEWKAADQRATAAALKVLPANHPLREASRITLRQRDLVRKCHDEKAKAAAPRPK